MVSRQGLGSDRQSFTSMKIQYISCQSMSARSAPFESCSVILSDSLPLPLTPLEPYLISAIIFLQIRRGEATFLVSCPFERLHLNPALFYYFGLTDLLVTLLQATNMASFEAKDHFDKMSATYEQLIGLATRDIARYALSLCPLPALALSSWTMHAEPASSHSCSWIAYPPGEATTPLLQRFKPQT